MVRMFCVLRHAYCSRNATLSGSRGMPRPTEEEEEEEEVVDALRDVLLGCVGGRW